ncbi:MAG: hypothetical protein WD826_08975 [Actinomycetota bacterium]
MRVLAIALTAWVAWRWFRFVVGFGETALMPRSPERRRLRQAWITSAAATVFLTVAAVLVWASELGRQPGTALIGFLAAVLMCTLTVAIIVKFTSAAEHTDDRDDGGTDHNDDQRREDAEQ